MPQTDYDVVGIGNAIVDVLAHADDAFLAAQRPGQGRDDADRRGAAERLYAAMGPGIEISGGSAANTVGRHRLARRRAPATSARSRDDQLGAVFRHDIRAAGVAFDTPPPNDGPPTARCLILVTPDAQRTMNTFLGACVELGPDDVDEATDRRRAQVTYLEGYLWDPPRPRRPSARRPRSRTAPGRKVALTLSDPFCVERHRAEFLRPGRRSRRHPVRQRARDRVALPDRRFRSGGRRGWRRDGAHRRRHPQREGLGHRRRWRACIDVPAEPVDAWSTPPAPATSTRRASSTGLTQGKDLPTCGRIGQHRGGGDDHPYRRPAAGVAARAGQIQAHSERRVLIVPGLGDSGPAHWQSHWRSAAAQAGAASCSATGTSPCGKTGSLRSSTTVRAAAERKVVLVGHSLACALVAHWAPTP